MQRLGVFLKRVCMVWLTALTWEICEAALNWTHSLEQNHHNWSEHLQVGYTYVILMWCGFEHRFVMVKHDSSGPLLTHLGVYHDVSMSFQQSLNRQALWLLLHRYTPACCDYLRPPYNISPISAVRGQVLLPVATFKHL